MATTSIPWGDGTSDNITLTYSSASGSQSVAVSSDENVSFNDRTKNVTFTPIGANAVTLSISQSSKILLCCTDNGVICTDNGVAGGDLQT